MLRPCSFIRSIHFCFLLLACSVVGHDLLNGSLISLILTWYCSKNKNLTIKNNNIYKLQHLGTSLKVKCNKKSLNIYSTMNTEDTEALGR